MLGMNLAGALGAMGVTQANAFAGRDRAPFRMCIGLPPPQTPGQTGAMQVVVPDGVQPGQQMQVTAPSGEVFQVIVPAGSVRSLMALHPGEVWLRARRWRCTCQPRFRTRARR